MTRLTFELSHRISSLISPVDIRNLIWNIILQFSTRRTCMVLSKEKCFFAEHCVLYDKLQFKCQEKKLLGKWNYVRKFMICELWWCGGRAMHYWNIWKAHSDNNDRSFVLVMEYFEMIYREISHEWLDQFLQEPILLGETNFHALVSPCF